MKFKISFLSVVMVLMSVNAGAQTARNPLNHEPMRMSQHQRILTSERLSEDILYSADGSQLEKNSLIYNENGRKKTSLTQRWNDDDRQWQNVAQCEYTYDGDREIAITSTWSVSAWNSLSKVETVYSPEGRVLYALSYSWNDVSDDWNMNPSMKNEWVYDENGRMVESLKQTINKETNTWNDSHVRILYAYNEDGVLNEETYQLWNPTSQTWVDKGRYTFFKEDEQHTVAMSSFYSAGKWINDGKIMHTYDKEGKVMRSEYYGDALDNSLKAYCIYAYTDNFISPEVIVSENISVHPNPVVSSFELTVPKSFVGKVAGIFDIYGKPVKSMVVNSEKMQVSASGLSSGVYVLKIDNKSAKFVVK